MWVNTLYFNCACSFVLVLGYWLLMSLWVLRMVEHQRTCGPGFVKAPCHHGMHEHHVEVWPTVTAMGSSKYPSAVWR